MRTLGVDLASAAEKTAWCLLEWRDDGAVVGGLELGADNAQLLEASEPVSYTHLTLPTICSV